MKHILKEIEVKNPLYVTTLENGVTLLVYGEYAEGNDGKKYRHIDKEVAKDEYESIGWCCEL